MGRVWKHLIQVKKQKNPRKAPGGEDKAGAAGPGSAPMEFRGGFGRGKPAQ